MERFHAITNRVRVQFAVWLSKIFILVLLSFLFFIAGGGVSHNSKWRIDHVGISGVNTVSEDAIRAVVFQELAGNYFFVYARENSYLFPKAEIEQMLLDTFPRLASVSAKKSSNNTITITVRERKPYALWCGLPEQVKVLPDTNDSIIAENCWFIDSEGFVFDKAPSFSKGVYTEVYGKLVEKNINEPLRASLPYDRFTTADEFAKLLRESIGDPLRIMITPDREIEITIYTSTQYPFLTESTIRFKDESQPETLMKNLQKAIPVQFPNNTALKKKLLYIDMRFGNKIIFGFEK